MQIIKRTAAADGTFKGPGGYGFAIRPVAAGATFPVTVQPDGEPGRAILLADAGSLLMKDRFDSIQVQGAVPGSTWELTILEDLREWRTSQADVTIAGGGKWETLLDQIFPSIDFAAAGYRFLDASSLAWTAPNVNAMVGAAIPFDIRAYRKVVYSVRMLAAEVDALTACIRGRIDSESNVTTAGGEQVGSSSGTGAGDSSSIILSDTGTPGSDISFSGCKGTVTSLWPYFVPGLYQSTAGSHTNSRVQIVGLRW